VKYDGPFGLKAGLDMEAVKASGTRLDAVAEKPGWFEAESVPTPHPGFETYFLQFSSSSGLCSISAIGKDIQTGDSGFHVRSAFESLDHALTEKYGKAKLYDFNSGAGSGNPEYWMMYLLQKDQTLSSVWDKEFGSTLPSDISSIGLTAAASNIDTGYLTLKYEFANIGDCVKETKARENQAL